MAAPGLVLVMGILALEVAYGVDLLDSILYLGYELCFIVVPGWLAFRALSSRPGRALRQLVFGWALGYVLEILAFMLSAATGTRALFLAYPAVVAAGSIALIRRKRGSGISSPQEDPLQMRFSWLVAVVCLAVVGCVAVPYFGAAPLPGAGTVSYFQDIPWALSIAADATHHWPIEDPSVLGQPMPYHYFIHIHLAAASQATGLGLPVVVFRLFILPMVVLVVLALVVAGQGLSRSPEVGLIGACLAFLIGQFNLNHGAVFAAGAFLGTAFPLLFGSASYLLGLVFFVILIVLVGERVGWAEEPASLGDWLLVALFMIGASDAKVAILPLILAALGMFTLWAWFTGRRVPRAVWGAAALAVASSVLVYLLQYRGHSSGFHVDPTAGVDFFAVMPAVASVKSDISGALPAMPGRDVLLSTGGILFGAVGLFAAQCIGVIWLFRLQGVRLNPPQAWLASIFGSGLLGLLLLSGFVGTQLYFLFYGMIGACLLSAEGLRKGWLAKPRLSLAARRLVPLVLAVSVILVGLMAGPELFGMFSGPTRDPHSYLLAYGGFTLLIVVLLAVGHKWLRSSRWVTAAIPTAAVLLVGALDSPLEYVKPALSGSGTLVQGRRITTGLYGALAWIRDNTPAGSAIAVNTDDMLAFDYPAFSERRIFLGATGYSLRSRGSGYESVTGSLILASARGIGRGLFPQREALNRAVFEHADPFALRELVREFNVRYLLIDRTNGYPVDERGLLREGRAVYSMPGALVVKLD